MAGGIMLGKTVARCHNRKSRIPGSPSGQYCFPANLRLKLKQPFSLMFRPTKPRVLVARFLRQTSRSISLSPTISCPLLRSSIEE